MRKLFVLALCGCGLAAAADAPYMGKWKMNVAKSDFGDTTVTYEQLAGGEMKATMDGQTYTFKTDGKDYPTPWGVSMSWKGTGANTWEVVEKANGKVSSTAKASLSADGKMLMIDSRRMKADGTTSNNKADFERVSGGPGLAGKWKTKKMTSSSPDTLTLAAKGDGILITLGDMGGTCEAKFDGKDYPAKGSMLPEGWACRVAKSGANALDLTWRKDGKDMYKATLTPSADGKTLTEAGSAVGVNEKYKTVYDRQ